MVDVIPFIVAMPKLSDYTLSSYSRWAEEVEALLALVGLPNAHKGTGAVPEADARSRAIILLTMERDLRDAMDDKIEKARTASDLWMAIKSYRTDCEYKRDSRFAGHRLRVVLGAGYDGG